MDVSTLPCECHSVNKISLLITTAHQQCLRSLAVSDECIPEWLSIICSLQNWGLVCWEATSGVKSRVLCHSSSVLLHLGRQRQHSVVICSGTLLFSSKVLHPSMVTLCSHKSGRCAVELYHDKTEWRLISATLQMKTLFRGWPVMVNVTHTRRKSALVHVWCAEKQKSPAAWQMSGSNCLNSKTSQ